MSRYVFTSKLPYCLSLKDDDYKVVYNDIEYLIRTKKIWTEYSSGSDNIEEYDGEIKTPYGTEFTSPEYNFDKMEENFINKFHSKNMEFIDDDTDHFRVTVVQIFLISETDYLSDDNFDELENEMLGLVNRFIEIYRITTDSFYLPLLRKIPFRGAAEILNLDTNVGHLQYHIDMQKVIFLKSRSQHENFIMNLLDPKYLNTTRLSLSKAKYYYSQSQYSNCITEAIIALEPIVHNAIKETWAKNGLSNSKINELIGKIDLHFMVSAEIPQILELNLNNIDDRQLYQGTLNSIKLRNKVIHKNYTEVSDHEALITIKVIEKMVDKLSN